MAKEERFWRMEELVVYTSEGGEIVLSQPVMGCDDANIHISVDQVDLLIKWLRILRNEARAFA